MHVSAGSTFPHPLNPAGDLPLRKVRENYDGMISSGRHAFRNYLLYRLPLINRLMQRRWDRPPDEVEGMHLPEAKAVKEAVSIPVLCTGGFQTASVVRQARRRRLRRRLHRPPARCESGSPPLWQAGLDRPPRPCTFSNKCLFNLLESPLGCYDQSRSGAADLRPPRRRPE